MLVDLGCLLGSDGETEAHGAERLCPVTGQAGWLLATPGSDPGLCGPSPGLVCILAVWAAGHCACPWSGPVRAGPVCAVAHMWPWPMQRGGLFMPTRPLPQCPRELAGVGTQPRPGQGEDPAHWTEPGGPAAGALTLAWSLGLSVASGLRWLQVGGVGTVGCLRWAWR